MTAVARSSGSSRAPDPAARLGAFDWEALEHELWAWGWARMPRVLDARACRALARTFDDRARFRSHVDMERHGFGRGDYRYVARPAI